MMHSPGASSSSSMTPPPVNMSSSSLSQSPALQQPTNARGTPRRPPKLRSSCDACGAAKVRCDKTQPRCGRCVAGGLNCVYGLSRKFGKAPRKKPPVDTNVSGETTLPRPLAQNAHQQQQVQQQQQHQQQQHHQQQQQQNSISCCPDYRHLSGATRQVQVKYEPQSAVSSNYGLEDSLIAMTSYAGHDMFLRSPDAMDSFGDHFSFPDTTTTATSHNPTLGSDPRHHGTVDPLDLTFPSTSDFQSFAEWIHPDDLMHTPESQTTHDGADSAVLSCSSSSSSSSSSLPSHHSSASISSLDSHSTRGGLPDSISSSLLHAESHNCHKLAYATLEGLSFRNDTAGMAKGEHLTQTMDKVLNRNKQAVGSMHQLLQCPCSKSPHLAMLYASITSKILMWYQLAAGCTRPTTTTWDYFSVLNSQPTPPLSASSSPSMAFVTTPTSPMSAAAAVQGNYIVTPMQFSVGAFSVDDESAQEALRKQLLLSELKKAGNLIDILSIQGRDELATGEVNDIYSALGTWLRCELNRTIASLKS